MKLNKDKNYSVEYSLFPPLLMCALNDNVYITFTFSTFIRHSYPLIVSVYIAGLKQFKYLAQG